MVVWSYLGTVTDILARLDRVDPRGTYSNRPLESLRKIYSSWNPQTTSNVNQRLSAVDGLRRRNSDIGWRVLLGMIPRSYETLFPSREPDYRDWKPAEIKVLRSVCLTLSVRPWSA